MLRLAVSQIKKRFGATQALSGVSVSARAGTVHAVLGENGAGKSTLMKILSGVQAPDEGSMLLDEQGYTPRDPIDARNAGVAIVYQEPMLCPDLTVAENVLLGVEPTGRFGLLNRAAIRERVEAALAQVGASDRERRIRSDTRVSRLAPSERQLVTIARALGQADCKVLILDEPTSSLPADDVTLLFDVIRRLKASGITILYISHFLEEVERIADDFTVLRDGHSVASGAIKDVRIDELVSLMAGREIADLFPRSVRTPGEVVLSVRGLAGVERPSDVSFELRKGEVLGIAGLLGSGRTELLRAVFGLDAVRVGSVRVSSYQGPASPLRRLAQGVGLLSEDRKSEGLAESLSLGENLTLSKLENLGPLGLISPKRVREITDGFIQKLSIRCRDAEQRVGDLSGGNQQKIALARLLYHDVDVFLLDEPTRGIDVHSRAQIYALIDELATRGKAVLMVSSYLPELLGVCDRIAVMRRGVLGEPHPAKEVDQHGLLLEAASA